MKMYKLRNTAASVKGGKKHIPGILHYAFQGLFILLQLALLVAWFLISRRYIAHFYMLCEFVSLCVVLYIVREDTNPAYKIPWIILNLALPVHGGLSYLMFGHLRLSRDERKLMKHIGFKYAKAKFEAEDAMDELAAVYPEMSNHAVYIRNSAAAPVNSNTAVEYFASGEVMFPRLLEALESAREFIFMEYFIVHKGFMWDSIEEVLARKASEGVDVRVMYDSIGSFGLVPPDFVQQLGERGIHACEFNKVTHIFSSRFNNRDHRKICVVDGNIGFTGGINLADEYINRIERFGYWKDTAVCLKGVGVRNLTLMFLAMWEFAGGKACDYNKYMPTVSIEAPGFVQPYADSPADNEAVGEFVYRNILCRARKYVYITTPYLIIDGDIISALSSAAKSGVDVRIITPGVPDKKTAYALTRSYYEVLIRSGVRIFEYTPGFMHAKMFVSDDECAVVGTINLDYRSLCHHFEDAVWMCGVPAIADIKKDMLECMDASCEVTLERCRSKSLLWRLWLCVLRILAPLF